MAGAHVKWIACSALTLACARSPAPQAGAEAPLRERTPATSDQIAAPEPRTSLFERAPAGAFAIARFEGSSMRGALELLDDTMRRDLPTLTTCKVALASITRAEAVATSAGNLVVEVEAGFGVDAIACVLGMPANETGGLRLGDVVLDDIPGGLTLRYRGVDGPTGPLPSDLAARLGAVDHAIVVVNLGEGARRMSFELDLTETTGTGTLRFADASRTDALLAWLDTSRSRLDAARLARLDALEIARTADGIRFAVSADDDTPRAAAVLREMAEPFAIPSTSMLPTLEPRDQMFVDRLVRSDELERGDVVVFRPPGLPDQKFVKRIVGLPGDRIRFVGGRLEIRGKKVKHGPATESFESLGLRSEMPRDFDLVGERIGDRAYTLLLRNGASTASKWIVVPEGHFFAVGDNRMQSHDSREFGPVPLADIHGRAVFVWLSLHDGAVNQQRSGIVVR